MNNIFKATSIFIIATLTLTSCLKEPLRGEGNIITETRSLASFNKLHLEGKRYAEIIHSNESKVEVTGYANLVNAYTAHVGNERLQFDYPNRLNVRNDNITLKIYTPHIEVVRLSGSTQLLVGAGFSGNRFEANISGSGDLEMLASNYNQLELLTSGSANINAREVVAERANINISGSAKMKIQVSDLLKVRISGSGEVHYWGNPTTDIQVSGSGKAIKQ